MFSILARKIDDEIHQIVITYIEGTLRLEFKIKYELTYKPEHMFVVDINGDLPINNPESYSFGSERIGHIYFYYSPTQITLRLEGPYENSHRKLIFDNPSESTLRSFISIIRQWKDF